jgi:hypothetical protein
MTSKLAIEVENFRPQRSNTLFGFATIFIPALHLRIVDCTVHEKNGARWISLPAKAQITKDGTVRRDDRGKVAYSTVLEFTDRSTKDAFSERVIAALLTGFPEAFDDQTAA